MKPQDVIVALALSAEHPPATYAELGRASGISTSEAHGAVQRLRSAGLVNHQRHVNVRRMIEFLHHGIRFVFPAIPEGLTVGVPTGAARFTGEGVPLPEGGTWVWPSPDGTERGLAIAPLHDGVVRRVTDAGDLWDLLALVDLLRAGGARERNWARQALTRRLGGTRWPTAMPAVDPARADALREMFSYARLRRTVSRRLHEPRRDPGASPIALVVLSTLGEEIVADLHTRVPEGTFRPAPADVIRHRKPSGDVRLLSFPGLLDAIVASRIMDELEPRIRADEDDRSFVARSRVRSLGTTGDYRAPWFGDWRAFLGSLDAVPDDMGMALRTDIRDFYASIEHALARQVLAQRTGAVPSVVDAIMSCVEVWSGDQGRGLPIDSEDVSALIAHAILRNVDEQFQDGPDLNYRRFVDDIVMFAPITEDLTSAKHSIDRVLERLGLSLNVEKTAMGPAPQIEAYFVDPVHDELNDYARAVEWLTDRFSEFANHEPHRQSLSRRRHILTLASRCDAKPLVGLAVDSLSEPGLRSAALGFLATQSIPGEALQRILQVDLTGWTELEDIQLVDALARSEIGLAEGELVLDWVRNQDRRAESEAVQARLHLLVFKIDGRAPEHWRPERSTYARVTADLLQVAATGSAEERLHSCAEQDLLRRLVANLKRGDFDEASLRAVVLDRRRESWRTEPEHLPLLHLLHRTAPKTVASWLDRLQQSRDQVLRRHVSRLVAS